MVIVYIKVYYTENMSVYKSYRALRTSSLISDCRAHCKLKLLMKLCPTVHSSTVFTVYHTCIHIKLKGSCNY